MKTIKLLAASLFLVAMLSACNKNYYSGAGKGGKNCGCPSNKGMGGF